jgi:transcriptional regulator with XRE-family HTH domain
MTHSRPISPYAADAARLLGARVAIGRRERRWSTKELAGRLGVSRTTLHKVESGDPTVTLGVALEAAALVGVPLFEPERSGLSDELDRARQRIALLPSRIRQPNASPDDDF